MTGTAGNHKGLQLDLSGARWRKSTKSGGNTDMCVEVAFAQGGVAVRDSKDRDGQVLAFTSAEWDAFVGGVKDGEFDL